MEKMPKTVFISGPMTGFDNFNKAAFGLAETNLISWGYWVFNPAKIEHPAWRWEDFLALDAGILIQGYSHNAPGGPVIKQFDILCQLDMWERSDGANMEYAIAMQLKRRYPIEIASYYEIKNRHTKQEIKTNGDEQAF